jgi:hypothetical protein
MTNDKYLYRGVSNSHFNKTKGALIPKALHNEFVFTPRADGTFTADGSVTAGPSIQNAVLRHQLTQKEYPNGYPTSGISTTPKFERAILYATNRFTLPEGIVYKINRKKLEEHKIEEFVVSEWVTHPSIPEDEEVILVSNDYGPLPSDIIKEIIKVDNKV